MSNRAWESSLLLFTSFSYRFLREFFAHIPLSTSNLLHTFEIFSMKHDLARSCFQLWLKIGDECDKISREKTGEALAETVFSRNFVTLGADFEGHN